MAEKALGCALTHVRHEGFFLSKWLEHYGGLFGRENLFVVIDGDDWTPEADLTGVSVEVLTGAPRRRVRNDQFMAKEMTLRANRLRARYRYVLRTDVDEYVALDPAAGRDWPEALKAVDEAGYLFALGVDMLQAPGEDRPVDRAAPILAQRRHGYVSPVYSKPFVISQRAMWTGGGHRLIGRDVRLSPEFILFHLALADASIATERHRARGGDGQHPSFVRHVGQRMDYLGAADFDRALDFDDARAAALKDFPVEDGGTPAKRAQNTRDPRAVDGRLPVRLPDRFAALV
jgi:hypothetical protein